MNYLPTKVRCLEWRVLNQNKSAIILWLGPPAGPFVLTQKMKLTLVALGGSSGSVLAYRGHTSFVPD